jgi:hypothetical protein
MKSSGKGSSNESMFSQETTKQITAGMLLASCGLGWYIPNNSPIQVTKACCILYGAGNAAEAAWLKLHSILGRQDIKIMHGVSAGVAITFLFAAISTVKDCFHKMQKHSGLSFEKSLVLGAICIAAGAIQSSYNRTHSGPAEEVRTK